MPLKVLSSFDVGDMVVRYLLNERTNRVGLQLAPKSMLDRIVEHRETLDNSQTPACEGDSLIHLALAGMPATGGFAQGRTMRHSPATGSLQYVNQAVASGTGRTIVATRYQKRFSVSPASTSSPGKTATNRSKSARASPTWASTQ